MAMNLNLVAPRSRLAIYVPVRQGPSDRMTSLEEMFANLEHGPQLTSIRKFESDEVKRWVVMKALGDGASSHVDLVRDQAGNCYAVKKMRLTNRKETNSQIVRDVEFMMKAVSGSPVDWIIRYHGYAKRSFEAWIVMEVMDSCFGKLIKKGGRVPEHIIGAVTATVVQALDHLKQTHNMMHRDVRPTNILVDKEGNIKLCDFGIARVLVNSMAHTADAGNKYYLAPERVFGGQDCYGIKSDVWSLGITLVELATGRNPYVDCRGEFAAGAAIRDGPIPTLPSSFSHEAKEFVSKCLQRDDKLRPNYKEMMCLPFFQNYKAYDKRIVGEWVSDILQD